MYKINKDQKDQLKDAEKTKEFLKTAKNNTSLSTRLWNDAIICRKEYVNEYIEFLKTGNRDSIEINDIYQKKDEEIQHFK